MILCGIEKPKLISTPIWANVFGFIGFIPFFFPSIDLLLRFIICIFVWLALFIYNLIKYVIAVNALHLSYINVCNNHAELSKQFDAKNNDIDNYIHIINEYSYSFNYFYQLLGTALIYNSPKEIEQITNLQKALLQTNEHIEKLKGGN